MSEYDQEFSRLQNWLRMTNFNTKELIEKWELQAKNQSTQKTAIQLKLFTRHQSSTIQNQTQSKETS